MRTFSVVLCFICGLLPFLTQGQNIENEWRLTSANAALLSPKDSLDNEGWRLRLSENRYFFYNQKSGDSLSGKYLYDAPSLVLMAKDNKAVQLRVNQPSEDKLEFTSGEKSFKFSSFQKENTTVNTFERVPNQGFTFEGFWRGALGMFSLILLAFLLSSKRKAINWKTVGIGLGLQLLLAYGVLEVEWVQACFNFVGSIFVKILEFTKAGSAFLLGDLMDQDQYGYIFLFQILPTVIFFSALTSVLFYLGVIQVVVKGFAWVLTKLLNVSGPEGLSVAGNIFLGQTEAPLMIKAYLERMTKSEILLVMVGGMSTVAGGVLAAYIGFLGGDDAAVRLEYAKHLLAASVMAAPGAIVISKMLYPQQKPITTDVSVSDDKIGTNILDAITTGTGEGLRLAANVAAMLLVFVALIAMVNYGFGKFGSWVGLNSLLAEYTPYAQFSVEAILGIIFAPLMWLIGINSEDVMLMGQLLGIKLAASEFVGYVQLAELKDTATGLNLTYQKSVIMATYMLCGFANFASIGIQLGGIGSLAPGQRKTLSQFGIKAVIGGTLASLLSATIAGMIIG
jgi:CNT family concentrative nucleoside transporter